MLDMHTWYGITNSINEGFTNIWQAMKTFTKKDRELFLQMVKDGIFFEFTSFENANIMDAIIDTEVDNFLSMSKKPLKTMLTSLLDVRGWYDKKDIINELNLVLWKNY